MRILIDLQALQTRGVATRGVGRYTNGLLAALVGSHELVGLRRDVPYLIPPLIDIPTLSIDSSISEAELHQLVFHNEFDVVLNCSGPNWKENIIVTSLTVPTRIIVASIVYDLIPWVFQDVYLRSSQFRQEYHNRCVDLYARADLVCAISQSSERDVLRFGYATHETATTISLGVEPLLPELQFAVDKWKIARPYLLSVSGDEYRKNPELLISAYLESNIRKSHSLVLVISNDAETGFSRRAAEKYGDLRAQGITILPEVTDSELGALYRDCDAFVFTSLYEGFGIPIVEAMQFGKWIISSKASSLAEVIGPALLSLIDEPDKHKSILFALDAAKQRLDRELLDASIPLSQSQSFSWERVVRNFEESVERRRQAGNTTPLSKGKHPRLFWASPFPADESGVSFYSEDLLSPISNQYDLTLVPNTISTFVPTPKTARFKIVQARKGDLLNVAQGHKPHVVYSIGNSHFHLNLLELLFDLSGTVLLHDSLLGGIEALWRQRRPYDKRALEIQIIEHSEQIVFLTEDAKSLLSPEQLSKRPHHVVPHFCRYQGAISASNKLELRRRFGIPDDAFVITTTGFQDRIKLTNHLARSCVELRQFENASVFFQVLGHFFNPELEREVRTILVENDIRAFLSAGFLNEELLRDRLALTDVAVFLRERSTGAASGGLSDALGCGIPCLVTDDFGFREYPETAVLRVSNKEITEGLILLHRKPAIRQALAAGALHYALEVSPERIAARLCEILSLSNNNQNYSTRERNWEKNGHALNRGHGILRLFRQLLDSSFGDVVDAKTLKRSPALGRSITRSIKGAVSGDVLTLLHRRQTVEPDVINESCFLGVFDSNISSLISKIKGRIVVELDQYAGHKQNTFNTLRPELFRDGLDPSASVYLASALRHLPESSLFESLSILLFKKPLDEAPLVRFVSKVARRRLNVLLICSALPGRRARITGLYAQTIRSILSKSPFFFSLAKRLYYRLNCQP